MQRGAKCLKTKRITLTGRLKLFKKGLAEKITQKIIDKSQTARIHGSWVNSKMSLGAAVTWWNISLFPKMPVFQLLLLFCTLVVYRWWHHQIGDCFLHTLALCLKELYIHILLPANESSHSCFTSCCRAAWDSRPGRGSFVFMTRSEWRQRGDKYLSCTRAGLNCVCVWSQRVKTESTYLTPWLFCPALLSKQAVTWRSALRPRGSWSWL